MDPWVTIERVINLYLACGFVVGVLFVAPLWKKDNVDPFEALTLVCGLMFFWIVFAWVLLRLRLEATKD